MSPSKLRAYALRLAIQAAPYTYPPHVRPNAAQLMADAELIEQWLQLARLAMPETSTQPSGNVSTFPKPPHAATLQAKTANARQRASYAL